MTTLRERIIATRAEAERRLALAEAVMGTPDPIPDDAWDQGWLMPQPYGDYVASVKPTKVAAEQRRIIAACDADLALNEWCVETIGTVGSFDDLMDAIDLIAENLAARYPEVE